MAPMFCRIADWVCGGETVDPAAEANGVPVVATFAEERVEDGVALPTEDRPIAAPVVPDEDPLAATLDDVSATEGPPQPARMQDARIATSTRRRLTRAAPTD